MKKPPKLIVFDLNNTLITNNSWFELNTALGVTESEDKLLVSWGQEDIISDAQGQAILCSIYKSRSNPTRSRVSEILKNYTYAEGAQETIANLQTMGIKLALISGAMDVLVECVAEDLGIEEWACNNNFIFDDNDILDSIKTLDNDEKYKVTQFTNLLDKLALSPDETMCVGDGANDIPLFEACGNSVTFEDSEIAVKTKYTIRSLRDLPKLFS